MMTKDNTVTILSLLMICTSVTVFQIQRIEAASPAITVPDDYSGIQEAIANVEPGGTVFVRAGIYDEQVVINKTLMLIGEDRERTILQSELDQDTVTVTASDVTISGFTIRNKSPSTHSYAVRLVNSTNSRVSNNTIRGSFAGVMIEGGLGNLIQHNLILRNRYGIFTRHLEDTYGSYGNVIYHNTVLESVWNGIEFDWGGRNVVYANTIANNTAYGLEIYNVAPSFENVIFHNNFLNNSHVTGTYQASGPPGNMWGYNGEGNYWSDYAGMDADHDGIGDTPHAVVESTVDYFPLMGTISEITIFDHHLTMICNFLVTRFSFVTDGLHAIVSVAVLSATDLPGFCRVLVPETLMTGPYQAYVNGSLVADPQFRELPCSNGTHKCLYVNFSKGEHTIKIVGMAVVPEFPHSILLTLLMVLTLTVGLLTMKRPNRRTLDRKSAGLGRIT